MRDLLRAADRGLWALRYTVDLAGIGLITALFILFGLQFQHPAAWDNMAGLIKFRKVADPLLAQIASGVDLVWPSEKPSFLPLLLSVAVFFVRSFLVHGVERVSGAIRRRITKSTKTRKKATEAADPPAPPASAQRAPDPPPSPAESELAPPPITAVPPPIASAVAPAVGAGATVAGLPSDAESTSLSPPSTVAGLTPRPTVMSASGASLSDFLHLGPDPSDAPTKVGRTPRPETSQPGQKRRRAPASRDGGVDRDAPTLLGQNPKTGPGVLPVFGRYELLEELGRGGMGVVYKARDPKIDRVVAIKSILTSHSDDESSEEYERRFRREVKAVGKLTHSAIVTVYDFIEDHLGRPAMVMEFVEGETLQQFAARQRPSLERTLEIMIAAAEALDHAHAQGIVHRDMKPANILIGRDGRAKVSDFGIAKVGGGTNTNTKGSLVGTPAFMSPEQFLGRKIDGRSDIFSLGGILYWLCTGERPFVGDTVANLAYQIVHLEVGSVLKFNPNLPPQLDEILATCLAKNEAHRYGSARDLAEDLKALRDGRPLPSLALAEPSAPPEIIDDMDMVVEVLDETEPSSN